MTKEQKKRLEEIRETFDAVETYGNQNVVFLLTLIDEQAAEVERLKIQIEDKDDHVDYLKQDNQRLRGWILENFGDCKDVKVRDNDCISCQAMAALEGKDEKDNAE